jgi:glycosyltransferase involved in cell wall biosynthesis
MKICFIADMRSSIAHGWITPFVAAGDEVHVISSYPCDTDALPGASVDVVPLAFGGLLRPRRLVRRSIKALVPTAQVSSRLLGRSPHPFEDVVRHWLGTTSLPLGVRRIRQILHKARPDIVHALRIPFEGIAAALAVQTEPLVISVWGNDLTLWARRFPVTGFWTRRVLRSASGLHCDCHRDLRLASEWGFHARRPGIVLPGAGGVDPRIFGVGTPHPAMLDELGLEHDTPLVLNPRGMRAYIRTDTFFRAIPSILAKHPEVRVLATDMAGEPAARRWIRSLGLDEAVRLLPRVPQDVLADLFRASVVTVSPAEHDGMPNSVLEAMACGSLPVAADIASLREWVEDGVNGLLFDTDEPASLAAGIVRGLEDAKLRQRASALNVELIQARALLPRVTAAAREFYQVVARRAS